VGFTHPSNAQDAPFKSINPPINKVRKVKHHAHKSRKRDLISFHEDDHFVQVLTIRKGVVNDCSHRYAFRNSKTKQKNQNSTSVQGKSVNVPSLLASKCMLWWTNESTTKGRIGFRKHKDHDICKVGI